MKQITIGIPTYRRARPLRYLLEQIVNSDLLRERLHVKIVNDSGLDSENFDYQTEILDNKNFSNLDFEYKENKKNEGFARTFCNLIEQTETSYLLVMADDDLLVEERFQPIIDFLHQKTPCLLSSKWISRSGRIGRGTNETRKITLEEHRISCGHVPGLILDVQRAREFLPLLYGRLDGGCVATHTYPSVVLHIPLLLKYDNSWYFNAPIAREGSACASGIKDTAGFGYSNLASRIQQLAALDQYILNFPQSSERDRILKSSRAWAMVKAINSDADLRKYVWSRLKPDSAGRRIVRAIERSLGATDAHR